MRPAIAAAGGIIAVSLAAAPIPAAQRAFVASYGADANAASLCSLQAPEEAVQRGQV